MDDYRSVWYIFTKNYWEQSIYVSVFCFKKNKIPRKWSDDSKIKSSTALCLVFMFHFTRGLCDTAMEPKLLHRPVLWCTTSIWSSIYLEATLTARLHGFFFTGQVLALVQVLILSFHDRTFLVWSANRNFVGKGSKVYSFMEKRDIKWCHYDRYVWQPHNHEFRRHVNHN